jgi:hypothetical protein
MNTLLQALVSDQGWGDLSQWPRPLAYGLAALVCFLLGTSTSPAQRTPPRMRQLWLLLCPLYLLAAASCLVQGDVLWVHWARTFARAQHLYEERRIFQLGTLLGLVFLASKVLQKYRRVRHQSAAPHSVLHRMLLSGAAGTLTLFLLRYVSFHYTDLVLNAVWLNHSVASWMELASLGLVALATAVATTLEMRRSYGPV